jgi:hypothetical protein
MSLTVRSIFRSAAILLFGACDQSTIDLLPDSGAPGSGGRAVVAGSGGTGGTGGTGGRGSDPPRCGSGVICEPGTFCIGVGTGTCNFCGCGTGTCTAAACPPPDGGGAVHAGGADAPNDCDPVPARLRTPNVVCPYGELRSIVNGEWGPCVPYSSCRPIPCEPLAGGLCPWDAICDGVQKVCVDPGSGGSGGAIPR